MLKKKKRITMVFFSLLVLMFLFAQSAYALPIDFKNLSGKPSSGPVKIKVESLKSVDDMLFTHPKRVSVSKGENSSYIPVITNLGDECNLRIRMYASSGDDDIDIIKYCHGFEDSWIKEDGWLYYNRPFKENEKIIVCESFDFPSEWDFNKNNLLEVSVEAEAVSDEVMKNVKTTDRIKLLLPFMILAICFSIITYLVFNARNANKKN